MPIFGIISSGRSTVNYLYLVELVPKNRKILVGTIYNAINELTLVFSSFYFMFISKEADNWIIFSLIATPICSIAYFFIPESPDYLYEK